MKDSRSLCSRFAVSLLLLAFAGLMQAQSSSGTSGTVRGSVLDPSGAAIVGAAVDIQNPVSHYSRSGVTDSQGRFEFDNLPDRKRTRLNSSHLGNSYAVFCVKKKNPGACVRNPASGVYTTSGVAPTM